MPTPTSATSPNTTAPTDKALQTMLLDMGLAQLRTLPSLLEQEHAQIEGSLAALAADQHLLFLQANACARDIGEAEVQIRETSTAIRKNMDALDDQIGALKTTTNNTSNADVNADVILRENYDELLDLLAIPGLLEAFVRAGAYEDALDLAAFVQRLMLRHKNILIVQNIAAQVAASTSLMLELLVAQLKTNAKLPTCIRVIGYLRRMDVYPETELRLVFLQQKDAYFRSLLKDIRETDPADFLKKYIEVSRENFFDIITQYKAIFADGSSTATPSIHHYTSLASSSSSSSTNNNTPAIFHQSTTTIATSSILSSYVTQTVSLFLSNLSSKLDQINDTQSLNSLLTQTMYYGMSLGRVGVDFRILVTDLFLSATERIFTSILTEGVQGFYNWIQSTSTPTLQGFYIKQMSATSASSIIQPSRQSSFSSSSTATSAGVVNPPTQLLPYPPLSHLLNVFYTAFNALRVLPATPLKPRLRAVIESHLIQIAKSLKTSIGKLESEIESLNVKLEENERFLDVCGGVRVYVEVLSVAVLDGFELKLFGGGGGGGEVGVTAATTAVPREVLDLLSGYIAVLRKNASLAAVEDRKKGGGVSRVGGSVVGKKSAVADEKANNDSNGVDSSKPADATTVDVPVAARSNGEAVNCEATTSLETGVATPNRTSLEEPKPVTPSSLAVKTPTRTSLDKPQQQQQPLTSTSPDRTSFDAAVTSTTPVRKSVDKKQD
ncbi:UNVERIFIED_CONTAM: conserved oligomeric Golgi complex component [Siphonaria sp. JEL0065]|nr:conserved oligomeric Golgi complex component [Siphonaria sp. JEL0065]